MKFGVNLPTAGPFASPSAVEDITVEAERLGYDFVWLRDHLTWGEREKYSVTAGSVEAVDRMKRATNLYESLTSLAYLAGITKRIRMVTGILVLPWRNPLWIARECATIQELSGGRLVLGVGVGASGAYQGGREPTFYALNLPFEKRQEIIDEYIRVIKLVLSPAPKASFSGKYIKFKDVEVYPKPKIPIWYGGHLTSAIRRTAALADGWFPGVKTPEFFKQKIPLLKKFAEQEGRDPEGFDVATVGYLLLDRDEKTALKSFAKTIQIQQQRWSGQKTHVSFKDFSVIGNTDDALKQYKQYKKAGVDYFGLMFMCHTLEDFKKKMQVFADKVMNECR